MPNGRSRLRGKRMHHRISGRHHEEAGLKGPERCVPPGPCFIT